MRRKGYHNWVRFMVKEEIINHIISKIDVGDVYRASLPYKVIFSSVGKHYLAILFQEQNGEPVMKINKHLKLGITSITLYKVPENVERILSTIAPLIHIRAKESTIYALLNTLKEVPNDDEMVVQITLTEDKGIIQLIFPIRETKTSTHTIEYVVSIPDITTSVRYLYRAKGTVKIHKIPKRNPKINRILWKIEKIDSVLKSMRTKAGDLNA